MFYKECPLCGANLDPCEKCDCTERKEACTAATEQTSNTANSLKNLQDNYTTAKEICQAGGALDD